VNNFGIVENCLATGPQEPLAPSMFHVKRMRSSSMCSTRSTNAVRTTPPLCRSSVTELAYTQRNLPPTVDHERAFSSAAGPPEPPPRAGGRRGSTADRRQAPARLDRQGLRDRAKEDRPGEDRARRRPSPMSETAHTSTAQQRSTTTKINCPTAHRPPGGHACKHHHTAPDLPRHSETGWS
jgi:hypothetical protein